MLTPPLDVTATIKPNFVVILQVGSTLIVPQADFTVRNSSSEKFCHKNTWSIDAFNETAAEATSLGKLHGDATYEASPWITQCTEIPLWVS
jgi:hypothetical protein